MKKNKKNKRTIELQMKAQLGIENHRGETFIGFRSVSFNSKKNDVKLIRQDSKKLCAGY